MSSHADFPGNPASVAAARHFTREALAGLSPTTVDRATLIVSELVSNAIRHAHSGFGLAIDPSDVEVRIEVTDDSGAPPVVRQPERMAPAGRGLLIVEALSEHWGVTPSARGKTVWAVLATTAAMSRPISASK